jgi:hypothetical protein
VAQDPSHGTRTFEARSNAKHTSDVHVGVGCSRRIGDDVSKQRSGCEPVGERPLAIEQVDDALVLQLHLSTRVVPDVEDPVHLLGFVRRRHPATEEIRSPSALCGITETNPTRSRMTFEEAGDDIRRVTRLGRNEHGPPSGDLRSRQGGGKVALAGTRRARDHDDRFGPRPDDHLALGIVERED